MLFNPGHADARFWMGKSYFEQGEYEHAKIEFERFLSEFPSHKNAQQAKELLKVIKSEPG
jgi:TolA-binding protein